MLRKIQKAIQAFFSPILDVILPERTDFKIVQHLTYESIVALPPAGGVENMPWITALFQYKHPSVKAIIWELKYRGTTIPLEHIGNLLHEEIITAISDIILFEQDAKFLLLPVPITLERRAERGYNQSEYIARSILEHDLDHILLYAPQWFEKTRDTAKQSRSASRAERLHNLTDCFQASNSVAGHYVILVDDVVTTGSTLSEARRTLLDAGARDVLAFTIAH